MLLEKDYLGMAQALKIETTGKQFQDNGLKVLLQAPALHLGPQMTILTIAKCRRR